MMDQVVSVRDEESSLSENGDTTFDRTNETDEIKDIKKEKLEKNISENSGKGESESTLCKL